MGACAILLAFALLANNRRAKSASRAQQVILACATFDPEGRLLVTPEGMIPTEKITNSFEERVRISLLYTWRVQFLETDIWIGTLVL